MYQLGLGSTTLYFDWLWFSLMVSVAKRSFSACREIYLSVGIRIKNTVKNYTDFGEM